MNGPPGSILNVEGLSKRFVNHERQQQLQAFEDVSFSAESGDLVALVGSSGSGKSSILKCIYRTYLPTRGRIFYRTRSDHTVDLAAAADAVVLQYRRTEIRFVRQFLRVLPRRSALQTIEITLREYGKELAECQAMARDYLDRVGLPRNLWNLPPNTFSGGERQLLNLAQALAVEPRLLLLDEPTASLDPRSAEQVLQLIETLKRDDLAIIGVFHDRSIVERLADQTVAITGGLASSVHMEPSDG